MLTVQTPATDRTLVTLDELRTALGLAADTYETELTALNTQIADTLADWCGLAKADGVPPTFRVEALVETFRLEEEACHLILARRPIVSVASIVEWGVTLTTNDWEKEGGLLYRLDGNDCRWEWPEAKIVVTYTAGWSTVPTKLKLAATKLARMLWAEDGPDARDPGLKRERVDGVIEREWWVSADGTDALPKEVTDLLTDFVDMGDKR